jgi:hypothetical protein
MKNVRKILSSPPHYPIAVAANVHYVTVTGIEEACCKNEYNGQIQCEDQ